MVSDADAREGTVSTRSPDAVVGVVPRDPEHPMEADEVQAGRRLYQGLISLGVLVALVVGLLLAVPGLHGVGHDVARMSGGFVAAGVGLELISCVGYIIAFLQVFDRAPVRFGARVALSELAFGAAVSLGGAGSVAVGALLLVERGAKPSRVAERSAILFLLTSAINVITLAGMGLLLWVGVLPGVRDPLLSLLPGAVGVAGVVGFMLIPVICDRWVGDREGRVAVAIRATAETVRATEQIIFRADWRIIGAWLYLWADIFVFVVCFWALGVHPPLTSIVLAYQIGYLSNFLPIPGGVGILDGSFVGLLVLYKVKAAPAAAATVVYHAITLWIPAMWGTGAFLALRRSRKQPLTLRPPREERLAARRARRRLRGTAP